MKRASFILYADQYPIIEALTDEEAGKLFKAIFQYVNGEEPKLEKTILLAFIPIKQTLDRDFKKWENIVNRNRENIKKRYLPKATKSTSGRTGIPKALDSVSDSVSDIYKEKQAFKTEEDEEYGYSPVFGRQKYRKDVLS